MFVNHIHCFGFIDLEQPIIAEFKAKMNFVLSVGKPFFSKVSKTTTSAKLI